MNISKALSFVLHFLMLLFWTITALFFLNVALNTGFRIYMQKVFIYSEPNVFLSVGLVIAGICLILGFILYRQNRYRTLNILCNNGKVQVSSSFVKDLITHFFKKHDIQYRKLDVLLHKQKLKVFVRANKAHLEGLEKFEEDLSQALRHQVGYAKPFKVSFELSES